MARSALRVALPRSGSRVALPRSGLRVALPRSGVLKTVHFRRFDPLRSKIFFGPRATRDGQRATRERYAQALRASATRKRYAQALRLRQLLDNSSRLVTASAGTPARSTYTTAHNADARTHIYWGGGARVLPLVVHQNEKL